MKNHKATKPAFNFWPSSAFAGGPLKARLYKHLDPPSSHQLKKVIKVGPPLTKLSASAHDTHMFKNNKLLKMHAIVIFYSYTCGNYKKIFLRIW